MWSQKEKENHNILLQVLRLNLESFEIWNDNLYNLQLLIILHDRGCNLIGENLWGVGSSYNRAKHLNLNNSHILSVLCDIDFG